MALSVAPEAVFSRILGIYWYREGKNRRIEALVGEWVIMMVIVMGVITSPVSEHY